jgi:phosphoribosylamine---glycine ligase
MRVLVVGSGGREHALCWAIRRSKACEALYCAPGNAGIAEIAECVDVAADNVKDIVAFSRDRRIDLVVVGPESALVAGVVDQLSHAGIRAFGPTARAAAIEGSKVFMKEFCTRHGIPTAEYARFDEPEAAKEHIHRHGAPVVVKADGLCGGKGVIVCRNENEGFAAIDHLMIEAPFGDACAQVVIEELLTGEEASFFALVNGHRALPLASAQDHKPAYDGDHGPNTGGMGAYSPAPIVTDALAETIMTDIVRPTVDGLMQEGRPYCGILYVGLMISEDGAKVLEFNARMGDPECQPLVVRLKSDVLEVLAACTDDRMEDIRLEWDSRPALTVVMAAHGYPGPYRRGSEIRCLDKVRSMDDVVVFHAGTRLDDGKVVANGGRVLGVTAASGTIEGAQRRAYEAVDLIDWPEGFCRRDIGWRAIARANA